MECPFCSGIAELQRQAAAHSFRKERFEITEHFHRCNSCNKEFTVTGDDQVNYDQVVNQYRVKHHILFPEQLTLLREKYDLSAAKMSEVLGFGINQYNKYENGEVPSDSNAALLNLIREPENFRDLVNEKKYLFSGKQFDRIQKKLDSLIGQWNSRDDNDFGRRLQKVPDEFTGYRIPDIQKFNNLVLYFIETTKPFNVKLNKLLFYSDFLHFKNSGFSITGTAYRAIQLGPVPADYEQELNRMVQEGLMEEEFVEFNANEGASRYTLLSGCDPSVFTPDELKTIETVVKKLGGIPTKSLIDLSHQEKGWQEQVEKRGLLSYRLYGFELIGV